jgi:hypothetical protein
MVNILSCVFAAALLTGLPPQANAGDRCEHGQRCGPQSKPANEPPPDERCLGGPGTGHCGTNGAPSSPPHPGLPCPELGKLCDDGRPATFAPGSCQLVCPEDENKGPSPQANPPSGSGEGEQASSSRGLRCQQPARTCKNGQPGSRKPGSCEQICPEDGNSRKGEVAPAI